MDWVNKLPEKVQDALDSLLNTVEHHEDIYLEAENASVGQIWVGMAIMNERLTRVEEMLQAQRKALKDSNIDTDRHLDKNLEESLKNY